jgi:hypothetical protein
VIVSFDLVVLAIEPDASDEDVAVRVERCRGMSHPEGDLDERIVAFYEQLRERFPDFPPYGESCPWMSMPLGLGIDHVSMNMTYGERGSLAMAYILELAGRYGLTVYDPQFDEVFRPNAYGEG